MAPRSPLRPHPTRASNAAGAGLGDPGPRVQLKPEFPKTGYVDGAWWPYTDELPAELRGLIPALRARLGPVRLVRYHLIEWATPLGALVVAGQPVQFDWRGYGTVHTVELRGTRGRRLVLLVVPAETESSKAFATMTSAATKHNTSTVGRLLQGNGRSRTYRNRRADALRRWAARTTSLN